MREKLMPENGDPLLWLLVKVQELVRLADEARQLLGLVIEKGRKQLEADREKEKRRRSREVRRGDADIKREAKKRRSRLNAAASGR